MRIWSLSPEYLDTKGLVALRRETLLAKNVLLGNTVGYRNHPQLLRFKEKESDSIVFLDTYLRDIFLEAQKRGYSFDEKKIGKYFTKQKILVTSGQVFYEWEHLLSKLEKRDVKLYEKMKDTDKKKIRLNFIFKLINGGVESWESL